MSMLRVFPIASAALAAPVLLAACVTAALAADPQARRLGKAGDFSLALPDAGDDAAPSGFYARADAGYGWAVSSGDGNWTLGGGVGYRFANWLRVDLTVDYDAAIARTGPLGTAHVSGTTFLANAYWDLPSFNGITPYVGGGIGFAITDTSPVAFTGLTLPSQQDMQFAWSLAAGLAYAIAPDWTVDLGYRFVNLGDVTIDLAPIASIGLAPVNHQFRIGLRYALH